MVCGSNRLKQTLLFWEKFGFACLERCVIGGIGLKKKQENHTYCTWLPKCVRTCWNQVLICGKFKHHKSWLDHNGGKKSLSGLSHSFICRISIPASIFSQSLKLFQRTTQEVKDKPFNTKGEPACYSVKSYFDSFKQNARNQKTISEPDGYDSTHQRHHNCLQFVHRLELSNSSMPLKYEIENQKNRRTDRQISNELNSIARQIGSHGPDFLSLSTVAVIESFSLFSASFSTLRQTGSARFYGMSCSICVIYD